VFGRCVLSSKTLAFRTTESGNFISLGERILIVTVQGVQIIFPGMHF
jgi:hypothetical protein